MTDYTGKTVQLGDSDLHAFVICKCPSEIFDDMKARYKDLWEHEYTGDLEDTYIIYIPVQEELDESYLDIERGRVFYPK